MRLTPTWRLSSTARIRRLPSSTGCTPERKARANNPSTAPSTRRSKSRNIPIAGLDPHDWARQLLDRRQHSRPARATANVPRPARSVPVRALISARTTMDRGEPAAQLSRSTRQMLCHWSVACRLSPLLQSSAVPLGRVAELADAQDSGSCVRKDVGVQVPLRPGLGDAHVHLVASAGPELARDIPRTEAERTLAAVGNARRHLDAGVTLVRDLGATAGEAIAVGRAIEAGTIEGPRVIAAGPAVTMTGGHIAYLGRVADGAEQMRAAVRANLALGAGCIKVVATGGVLT